MLPSRSPASNNALRSPVGFFCAARWHKPPLPPIYLYCMTKYADGRNVK